MRFKNFIESGQVRKGQKDISLAKSLVKTAKQDLVYLQTVKIDKESARKTVTNYYDTLRSLLEAETALKGYKVYSHEAFTYYLKEKGEENFAIKFDRFRKIRNKINYYGQEISPEEAEEYCKKIQKFIKEKIGQINLERKNAR